MQTLILINPVAGPPRLEGSPADSSTAEMLNDAFADLMAGISEELPPNGGAETSSLPLVLAALPEDLLPARQEPIGAVQGLAEAAVFPSGVEEHDRLTPDVPLPGALDPEVNSGNQMPDAIVPPADQFGWTPVSLVPVMLPSLLPQDVPPSAPGLLAQGQWNPDQPDRNQQTGAGTNLTQSPLVGDESLSMVGLPLADLPRGTTWVTGGSKVPATLGASLPESSLHDSPLKDGTRSIGSESGAPASPADGLPQFPLSTSSLMSGNQFEGRTEFWRTPARQAIAPIFIPRTADQSPPHAELTRAAPSEQTESDAGKAILPTSAPVASVFSTLSANGAALLWQAGLVPEEEQSAPAEMAAQANPGPSGSRTPNPSAVFLRSVAEVVPTLYLDRGLVSGLTFLANPADPDHELGAEPSPTLGPVPASGSAVSGIGYVAAAVSLQDLPRLAVQLAGTLVHRADGQTEVALSPEELGHVRLSMQADAQNPDRIIVILTFERPETLDLFRRHADQLADALRAAGYSGADISFGRSGGENANDWPDPDRSASALVDTAGDTASTPLHHLPRNAAIGSLDLRL